MAEAPSSQPTVTIVGAGLAGTLLACALARAGYRVDLHEKRPDPRRREQEHGRSINLALSVRGIHALREVGLAQEVLKSSILMRGRMIHAPSGELTFQPYGKDDSQALHSVSRAGLNLLLVEAAARNPLIRLFFEHKCTGVDPHAGTLEFLDSAAQSTIHVPAELIVGADGAYSAVRGQLQKQERFNYRQDYLGHGYKELTIPAGPGGSYRLEKHALHIWPRGDFMMIALPNQDGSFTCTLFWPFEGPNSFAALQTEDAIQAYFQEQFPDVVPLIPTLARDFLDNPTSPLVTIRCQPWHWGERVVLLGDACHAVVPFLGQGMNAAFEDCTVLAECLARHTDRRAAFSAYEAPAQGASRRAGRFVHRQFPGDALPRRLAFLRAAQEARYPAAPPVSALVRPALRHDRVHAHPLRRCPAPRPPARLGRSVDSPRPAHRARHPERMVAALKEPCMDLTYASYLKLDQLLDMQEPRSHPAEHDEMLFIITHQVYELWFKLQLHELDKIKRDFLDNHIYGAIATFKRARTIMKVMVEQIDILETLTPMSFNSFRARLENASGFQSSQFREFEFVLGYKRKDMLHYQQPRTPSYDRLVRCLHEPSVVDCFYTFLEQHGVTIPVELRRATSPRRRCPTRQSKKGSCALYKGQPDMEILFELMTDFDEGFQEWRVPAHQTGRTQHRQQKRNGRVARRRVPQAFAVSSRVP